MNGYIFLTLACAFFVAVESGRFTKHSPDGPVYDGLNEIIDDAIQQSHMISTDVAHRMNQTLSSIKEKVDQLKDNNIFTRKIESMKSQGGEVQKCLKQHELATAQFMRRVVNTYDSCSKDLKQEVNDAVGKISAQVSSIKVSSKRFGDLKTECVSLEEMNAGASVLCAVTKIAEIKEEIFEANKAVEKFIRHGVENVDTYANTKCQGVAELKKEFDTLSAKVETCVKNQ